ncbi:unnamed protein product [Linum trigynum]|uniref:Reverse transcriptase zinc-binding domain-containing protein n=1 Tax=Linum trigynum TaxID=586398 RepID=A0AAV2D6L8_9ROSI
MNEAFMIKIAWRLLAEPNSLWARVIRAKYLKETEDGWQPRVRGRISNLWQGVLRVLHLLSRAIMWNIQSGAQTQFWTNRWLQDGTTLADIANHFPQEALSLTVADSVLNREWNLDYMRAFLLEEVVRQIKPHQPSQNLEPDIPIWRLAPDGEFTLKTAYSLTNDEEQPHGTNPIWRAFWRTPATQRVHAFFWLAAHQRLLTNSERQRRHLTDTTTCSVCGAADETTLHVVRDYSFTRAAWVEFLDGDLDDIFFQEDHVGNVYECI